jgi:hypothetical protein
MNRRFLAIARWAADPEAITRERFRRLKVSGCSLRRAARATLFVRALLGWSVFRDCPPGAPPPGGRPGGGAVAT